VSRALFFAMVSSNGGTYRVKKAGVEFEHSQNHYQDTLVSPQEYLDHFRYAYSDQRQACTEIIT
jgi:hypothetical protein